MVKQDRRGDADVAMPAQRWRALWREYGPLLMLVVLLVVARSSFANHYSVPTGSMEPTLMPGDRVLVDMSAYGLRIPFTEIALVERAKPAPGDVAVFKSPADGTRLIKRVAAVGGQTVAMVDGRLSIDGRPLQDDEQAWPVVETFGQRAVQLDLDAGGGADIPPTRVPEGMVLALGDHRGASFDGRYFGLVPQDAFYGRAIAVYWRSGDGPVWKKL